MAPDGKGSDTLGGGAEEAVESPLVRAASRVLNVLSGNETNFVSDDVREAVTAHVRSGNSGPLVVFVNGQRTDRGWLTDSGSLRMDWLPSRTRRNLSQVPEPWFDSEGNPN